jgi:hypothetical protein
MRDEVPANSMILCANWRMVIPSVVQPRARSEGVKDAHDAGVTPVVPMVGHSYGLGKAFGLVVNPTRPNGVDAAPIVFGLRFWSRLISDLSSGAGRYG